MKDIPKELEKFEKELRTARLALERAYQVMSKYSPAPVDCLLVGYKSRKLVVVDAAIRILKG